MLGANSNVLFVGQGLLNQVLVMKGRMPLISFFIFTATATNTISRRAEQLQRWHKYGSMLMRKDEEDDEDHVTGRFYTPLFRA